MFSTRILFSVATLIVLTCLLSTTLALTEFEWRELIVDVYAQMTRYCNDNDYGNLAELFTEDSELLWPDTMLTGKFGVGSVEGFERGRHPFGFLYFAFVEVLYTSPEVVLVTHATYGGKRDKAITLFVKGEDNKIRIKLDSFNFNRLKTSAKYKHY